ncbi:MAG TPA: HEAT repeat domain-containing protein [Bryobacteraceae bacterium]|nr:HEAT repeat domain-containing protein [Bryobacteraceae bacterium]
MGSEPVIPDYLCGAVLVSLVEGFGSNPSRHERLISDLSDNCREPFYDAAIQILQSDRDSRGARFLLSVLISRNLLFRALSDPALERGQALTLARMALEMDPQTDIALAKSLAELVLSDADQAALGNAARVIEILGEISNSARVPSLMRVLRNASPYLRSKAVLIIGRGSQSVGWVKSKLAEGDPRVRANAVQSLWGVDSGEARELLRFAAHDDNNRVAGNAVLGLYRLGDCSVIPELARMADHESSLFRSTAAWVMGETGDPRFAELLGRMLADPDAKVRKRAFTSIARIKAAAAHNAHTGNWLVSGYHLAGNRARSGQRRVHVAVVSSDGREYPALLPAHFSLREGGQAVLSYKVVERPLPDAMSVTFVLPRCSASESAPWNQAALKCLEWKRPMDAWYAAPYLLSGAREPGSQAESELPPLRIESPPAAAAFANEPDQNDSADVWSAIWRSLRPGVETVRGKRHLIVFTPADTARFTGYALSAAILSSRASLQVISGGANPHMEAFCRRISASFQIADSAIETILTRAYLNLLARYEISYRRVRPEATCLRIRIHAPAGSGEVTIPLAG